MPSFTAVNTLIANCQPGAVITLESAVAAAIPADAGNYHVVLMLSGPEGFAKYETIFFGQALDTNPKTFARNYTLPANAPFGTYSFKASVRTISTWKWQVVTQEAARFAVDPSKVVLYGKHSPRLVLLRRQGNGFLPDDGKTYSLVAGDEFDGATLDQAKWWRRYRDNGGTLDKYNDELQRYIDNHVVSNGTLKLTARKRENETYTANGQVFPIYDSSMVRSRTTFQYGYVEARVKLPPGLGVWPAFWILADGSRPCEIDIMEYVREGVNEHADMVHGGNVHSITDNGIRWREDKYNAQYSYWRAWGLSQPEYFIADWHTFGLLWEPDQLINYIDGQPVVQRKIDWKNGGVDGGPASVICNLAMGGRWPTNNWTVQPSQDDQVFEVDYIRVWQRSDSIMTKVSAV